ncbi:TPA: hypothetical protein U1V99_001802 [Streptococcus suis]|nr:hypothetical protein [Streptococcus suis]HEM4073647.1 hypothetical protein [Streptococcus suis]
MSISYYDVLVDYEALVNQLNEVLQVLEEHQDYSNHAPIAVYLRFTRASRHTQEKHSKLHHAGKYRGTHRH